jgi:hypothetical protein
MKYSRRRQTPAGTVLPAHADGRTRDARRLKQVTLAFEAELGPENLTPSTRARVAAAVALSLTAEKLNGQLACGQAVDPAQVIHVAERLERILHGLKSKPAT